MIKVLNSSLDTLAILQNVVSPIILEELNRGFTFSFSTVIDGDKSSHVNYQNKISVENNYFNIAYTEDERTQDGIFINAQCEHVSYDLLSANFTAGFTATGLFSSVATTILSGTGFTVGTVASTASETISILESTNARQLLLLLASLHGGEIEWDKYAVNEVAQRGSNNSVQFRYRKNIAGVKRITDNRKMVGGLPTISYQISPAELEFEQGYIDAGVSSFESYQLGDTVRIIDEDLGIDTSLRIVKESHDVNQRMIGNVEISNFVENITDTITTIQTTQVAKNNIYNGCSIGPTDGFVAERSDSLVKTFMNATNGIEIDLRASTTSSYTPVFYVTVNTALGTANLFLAGDAILTGQILIGGTAFATAPFSVTRSGSCTAYDLTLKGGRFNIGTGSQSMQFNTTDGLFLGSTASLSAPFSITMSGVVTAHDITVHNYLKVDITTASIGFGNAGFSFIGADTAFIEYQEVTPASNSDFRIVVPNGDCTIANSLGLRLMDATESSFTSLRCADTNIYGELDVTGNISAHSDLTVTGSIYEPSGGHLDINSNTLIYFSASGASTIVADLS